MLLRAAAFLLLVVLDLEAAAFLGFAAALGLEVVVFLVDFLAVVFLAGFFLLSSSFFLDADFFAGFFAMVILFPR